MNLMVINFKILLLPLALLLGSIAAKSASGKASVANLKKIEAALIQSKADFKKDRKEIKGMRARAVAEQKIICKKSEVLKKEINLAEKKSNKNYLEFLKRAEKECLRELTTGHLKFVKSLKTLKKGKVTS